MKKVFALILAISLLVSVVSIFAACDLEDDGVTVVFYNTMGSNLQEVLNQYIEDFNEIYPNIKIVSEQVGSYDDVRDQTSKELMVGKGPNLAYCYPDHVALYNIGDKVVDLYSYIDSEATVEAGSIYGNTEEVSVGLTQAQKDDFIEGYYNEGTQFGDGSKMYTLPFSKSTEVLYYNKTFFEKNNIQVPTHWWCPDDGSHADCKSSMEYVCAQIKAIDSKSTPLGYDSDANWFITMCEQFGTDYTSSVAKPAYADSSKVTYYTFYNDENVELMKRFNTWRSNKWVTTQAIYGTYTSGLFTTIAASAEKSYMSIGSSAGATHQRPSKVSGKYPFDVGITSIPQADASKPKVISQGPSICMLKTGTEEQQMATWLFAKFLTTNVNFQADFSKASGYVPVLKSVNQVESYAKFLKEADGGDNIAALSAKVCLEQADAYYTSPAFVGSANARSEAETLLSKCIAITGKDEADIEAQIRAAFLTAWQKCEKDNATPQK